MSEQGDELRLWDEICPILPVSALLALAATSRSFARLLYNTPSVFRYLKLSTTHGRPPRSEVKTLYETDYRGWKAGGLTPRDHYAQDLLNVFDFLRHKAVLQDVTTLVLDGLNFPSALCTEAFNIQLLSIRQVKLLSEDAVQRVLRYLVRPSRPEGSPKLQGFYCFNPLSTSDASPQTTLSMAAGVTTVAGAQLGTRHFRTPREPAQALHGNGIDHWYKGCGRILDPYTVGQTWADLLHACAGIISFDAVLCRHCLQNCVRPKTATVSLRGCASCHSAPEGAAYPGTSPVEQLPLLSPPPLYMSTVRAAQMPLTSKNGVPAFFARCEDSLGERWCQACNRWWCESCYQIPNTEGGVSASAAEDLATTSTDGKNIKVHRGLCVERCLLEELYTSGGEGGMWGLKHWVPNFRALYRAPCLHCVAIVVQPIFTCHGRTY